MSAASPPPTRTVRRARRPVRIRLIDEQRQQGALAAERDKAAAIPGKHENAGKNFIELEKENKRQSRSKGDRDGAGDAQTIGGKLAERADLVKLGALHGEHGHGGDERYADQIGLRITMCCAPDTQNGW